MHRINPLRPIRNIVTTYRIGKLITSELKYESMIAESQEKIGAYKPVPYVPVVIA